MKIITTLMLPLAALAGLAAPAAAQSTPECDAEGCTVQLTADGMIESAGRLIEAGRLDEAQQVLAALDHSPERAVQRHLMLGHVAMGRGNVDLAIAEFRNVLERDPQQTRARLELGRALLMTGRAQAADHHFRLAEQADDLPDELARMVRGIRGVIRDQRGWRLDIDVGLAPDTNINNATDVERIDLVAGPLTLPVTLGENSRAQSGVGQTAAISGGIEIGLNRSIALNVDADARMINYSGGDFDDLSGTLAIGPEIRFNDRNRLTVQATAAQRFYGWDDAQRSFGLRADFQRTLNRGARLGLAIDGRRLDSGFGEQFSGWQAGIYGSYEQVFNASLVGSATIFARRDALRSEAYSNYEIGGRIGVGGELPLGINASVAGGVSRAMYDGPIPLFSTEARQDWRLNGQVSLGLRSLRVLGFSPSVTYGYSLNDSSVDLYESDRHRVQFSLKRYF
ncbi:surface lipoprotein assembly modifier [uncultured Parasphingopyxis sp.]|uniref:surface lipoprotein assembly modifier n=1 Tax=uncultured Parasphingopyxis sp. TaxID=1547918 RepID=UPI002622B393|nr:surface lipoprotein assembly modifier [uncultured Parasphingopyxis sp.]